MLGFIFKASDIFGRSTAAKEDRETYRPWDEETGEEVEQSIESCGEDGSYLMVWCDGNSHHPIIGEV